MCPFFTFTKNITQDRGQPAGYYGAANDLGQRSGQDIGQNRSLGQRSGHDTVHSNNQGQMSGPVMSHSSNPSQRPGQDIGHNSSQAPSTFPRNSQLKNGVPLSIALTDTSRQASMMQIGQNQGLLSMSQIPATHTSTASNAAAAASTWSDSRMKQFPPPPFEVLQPNSDAALQTIIHNGERVYQNAPPQPSIRKGSTNFAPFGRELLLLLLL